jgi:prevent-host-death family protein
MPRILKIKPQVVMKNGKPDAVIINIKDYRELLDRLEDKEDIADLERIRKNGLRVKKFSDFLMGNDNVL